MAFFAYCEKEEALGLCHTDLFSRQICKRSGKSAGSDGAVHIPGTQIGYDSKPVMLACFSTNEDDNFGYYDEVVLEYQVDTCKTKKALSRVPFLFYAF